MLIWRPTGLNELKLIYESGMRAFPARLIDQPIFYPVTNQEYAVQIARNWNTKSVGQSGYVLTFTVPDHFAARFEKRIVGASTHEELWVPAEMLPEFNSQIEYRIELIRAFFSPNFTGLNMPEPSFGGLHDAFHSGTAGSQLKALKELNEQGKLAEAVRLYNTAIFLSYPFWLTLSSSEAILNQVGSIWSSQFSTTLCSTAQQVDLNTRL